MSSKVDRFKLQLRRQLGFLARSCQSFDQGHLEEAIRIASIIRVLVHDTRHSTSLLSHLGAKDINVLTSCNPHIDDILEKATMAELLIQITPQGIRAQLDQGRGFWEAPVDRWWNQIVLIPPGEKYFTRKSLVLTTANKDGGAHIDEELTPEYEKVMEGYAQWVTTDEDGNEIRQRIRDMHFFSLRQLGFEILHSREVGELLE